MKEDHLVRAHLFLIFIGLLCYQHIRKELPENLPDEKVKSAVKMLKMVIAVEDESLQFSLANVNEKTKPILSTLGLKKYLPE
ncbi:hypothetical protein AKJ37_03900 [candidate division MSBL1 archaeon SCGC-AAA259I09]|uniref:Uncharacterized protein n=1 Tax=candidate division MSBL1 archaeon SCGC-AAA259I09 TaxID=1698267 RepID=A0A133US41_9EURY|nr:hypothetical protein AKJ37_03900 [candidate division MSBL1 archaeon SCGC-AAA259I09]